jgi:hypothetical protein
MIDKSIEIKDKDKFQDLYTIFVSQGIKLAKGMLRSIQKTPESVAKALVAIAHRLEESGAKNGLNFNLPVIFNGSRELLIYILSQAGIEADEEFVKKATGLMVGMYLQQTMASGKISKEEAQELMRQVQQQAGQPSPGQPGDPQSAPQQPGGLIAGQMGGAV